MAVVLSSHLVCVLAVILFVILTRLMCSCGFVESFSVCAGGNFVCYFNQVDV